MSTEAKLFLCALFVVLVIFLSLMLGAAWSTALTHDCRVAAMNTRLYDSAHIAQICGR